MVQPLIPLMPTFRQGGTPRSPCGALKSRAAEHRSPEAAGSAPQRLLGLLLPMGVSPGRSQQWGSTSWGPPAAVATEHAQTVSAGDRVVPWGDEGEKEEQEVSVGFNLMEGWGWPCVCVCVCTDPGTRDAGTFQPPDSHSYHVTGPAAPDALGFRY